MEEATPVTIYARLDPTLGAEFKATQEREDRTMQAIVERALRAYIANSKAAALSATVAAQPATEA